MLTIKIFLYAKITINVTPLSADYNLDKAYNARMWIL